MDVGWLETGGGGAEPYGWVALVSDLQPGIDECLFQKDNALIMNLEDSPVTIVDLHLRPAQLTSHVLVRHSGYGEDMVDGRLREGIHSA